MSSINLSVISQRTEQDIAVGIEPPTDRLDYLPWGTRSLKVAVNGDARGKIIIRPEPFDPDPDRIVSYTNEGEDIQFSWGGGWESGFELDYEPGTKKIIFFNVTHKGPETAEVYTTTLIAYDEFEDELGRLSLKLTRPAGLPDTLLTAKWHETAGGADIVLSGPGNGETARVPLYMSRWWPQAFVTYAPVNNAGTPPTITIRCLRDPAGDSRSVVEVLARNEGDAGPKTLATVDGDIQFPLVDGRQISADLYYMAGHWALRLWFFWLDKGVAKRPETQGRTIEERREIERWEFDQEIPDAERMDLVFDKELNLTYLCTDLHWHELWAPYEKPDEVLEAAISGIGKVEVVIRGTAGVKIIARAEVQKRLPDPDRTIDPSALVLERLRDPDRQSLDVGDITHKHTPHFKNVAFDANLTSSDVLKG